MTDTKVSYFCLIASSIALLLGDVLQVIDHDALHWTICLAISFLLFIGGIPAINSLMGQTSVMFRVLINCSLLIGALAGASMQVLFRTNIILKKANATEAIEALSQSSALALSTMVPGIFYPIGLILVSITLLLSKEYMTWKVILLLIGAVLFPVGHALGNPVALLVGDFMLICAWFFLRPITFNNFNENYRQQGYKQVGRT